MIRLKITKINSIHSFLDNKYKLYSSKDYSNAEIEALVDERISAIKPQLFLLKAKKLRKKRQVREILFDVNEYIWNYIDSDDNNVTIEPFDNFNEHDIVIKSEFLNNEKMKPLLKKLAIEIIKNGKILEATKYKELFEELIDKRRKHREDIEGLRDPIKKSLKNQDLSVNFIDNENWDKLSLKIKLNKKDKYLLHILDKMFNNGYQVLENMVFNNARDFFDLLEKRRFIDSYLKIINDKKDNIQIKTDKSLELLKLLKTEQISLIRENVENSLEDRELKLYVLNKVYGFCEKRIIKMTKSKDFDKSNINNKKFERSVMGALKNNITQKILSIGKFLYYFSGDADKNVEKITSFDLEYISAVDKINLNLNTSISQALKTLYVHIEDDFDGDILDLSKDKIYKKHKDQEFIQKINVKLQNIFNKNNYNITQIILTNLYYLRNSLLHYERTSNNKNSSSNIVKDIIMDDIMSYNDLMKENFISNEVFRWFSNEDLDAFIYQVYKNRSHYDKYIPSFSKLTPEMKKAFLFNPIDKSSESQIKSKIFLLKEIYYNDFINREFPLEEVMENIKTDKGIEETSFPEFEKIVRERFNSNNINLSILSKYILERYNQLVNYRKSNNDSLGEYIQINFKKIVTRAFKTFIEQEYPYIIEDKIELDNDSSLDFSNIINPYVYLIKQQEIYPFYIMCKLLPPKELNNLAGNIKEYLQYIKSIEEKTKSLNVKLKTNKVIEGTYIYQISNEMLDIVQFCLLSSGKIVNRIKESYIDKYSEDQEVYRNQINRELYGYLPKHVNINNCQIVEIEKPALIDASKRTKKDLENEIKYNKYKNYIDKVDEVRLSNLYSDLHSHLLSLGVIVERDIIYFILAGNYFLEKDFKKIDEKRKYFMYEKERKSINRKIGLELSGNIGNIFTKMMFNFSKYKIFRNNLMHFKYFINGTTQDKANKRGIIYLYERLSKNFLKYDRKLKNSVTVRLINTFKKYHLNLKISLSNNKNWTIKYLLRVRYNFKYQDNDVEKIEKLVTTSSCYQRGASLLLSGKLIENRKNKK